MNFTPVFVVGSGHSGTTLVATILGASSEAYLIPRETGWFLGDRLDEGSQRLQDAARSAGREFSVLVEKTPFHLGRIEAIRSVVPGARFVLCLRDPRDVVASLNKRWGDLDFSMKYARRALRTTLAHQSDPDCLVVGYEQLVVNLEVEVRRVIAFVGLEMEQEILRWYDAPPKWFGVGNPIETEGAQGSAHRINRAWQVRQPLMDRRGRYRELLDPDQIETVERFLGSDLARAGNAEQALGEGSWEQGAPGEGQPSRGKHLQGEPSIGE